MFGTHSFLIPDMYRLPPLLGLFLSLPRMSTKQPAVAVVLHSNQRNPLSLLHPPLVRSGPSGRAFHVVNLLNKCSEHEAFHF